MSENREEKQAEEQKAKRPVSFWVAEIKDAKKREEKYRKSAKNAVSIFESEKAETLPFNLLYSNTETLQSVLYNSLPKPVVKRRYNQADVMGKFASQVISRSLEYFIDSNDRDISDFDEMIRSAVLEGLVPGRGCTRFRYESEIETVDELDEFGQMQQVERVAHETVSGEEIPWNRIYFGYAKQWAKVPWLAFEHAMTTEDLEKNFPDASGIPLTIIESEGSGEDDADDNPKDIGNATLARIYEIWDKTEREVLFICPDFQEKVLKRVDDPLGLSGFYPIPKPLIFCKRISSLIPLTLFSYYEEQNKELNRITIRINKIVKALKVRGLYDASVDGIEKVLTSEDNKLHPVQNLAAIQDGGTLEKAIWLVPIEKLINVLQQLYIQRQQVKQIIYEITAIADIMRGSSAASETLGAQQLKSQWGTLRIKRLQKETQQYVRDCLRIVAEITFKHCSQDTIKAITGVELPTAEEKQQATAMLQQMKMQQQMSQQQQVPPPPEQLLLAASLPSWEDLLALMKDDLHRNYKVDIETNSTVDAEATEDKKDVSEFLNALAQFLNGVFPIVQNGMLPFESMKGILGAVTRRFKFGTDVEDALDKMQPPKPPPEAQQGQQDAAAQKQKMETELQMQQMEVQLKQKETEARLSAIAQEQQISKIEVEFKLQELRRKDELAVAKHRSQIMQLAAKAQMANTQANQKEATNATV